ncbi:MAG: DUF2520 domain-containing protein [Bacteroidales bacterium]|nr:DUF2520 domain-containing protein [Bacteroidales bacterium]
MKKTSDLNIVILGNGHVATHLSEALLNAEYSVLQLWKRGEKLRDADLYFIAVSDDSIEEVAKLIPENKPFAHTSGSVNLTKGGVFYPLQTFSKDIDVDWKNIPIFVEYNNVGARHALPLLLEIAEKISNNVQLADAEKRRQLHLSAVFACNFTNHLWTISEDLLNEKNLSFDLLKPLIYQTVRKIETKSPKNVQTGPAIRHDLKTLEKHRKLLNKNYLIIYDILTKSIQDTYGSH